MYRFIIERSDKIVHLRGQKYSLAKKTKNYKLYKHLFIRHIRKKHDKEHLFHQ